MDSIWVSTGRDCAPSSLKNRGLFSHPAIKNDSSAILGTGNDVEDHVPKLSSESVGKFGRLVSMLLIPAKSARQATCHLDCRSTHQLADVLRDRGRAHPSLPELSQLLRDAMGACSQFMKHAREGKVALPQRNCALYRKCRWHRRYPFGLIRWIKNDSSAILAAGKAFRNWFPYHSRNMRL